MSLFEAALEYALLHAPAWGDVLICLRGGAGFGYRVHGKVPVISVPLAEADIQGLSMLAWLFGLHVIRINDRGSNHSSADAWNEAEVIFTDLCLLTDLPHDSHSFRQQRLSFLGST